MCVFTLLCSSPSLSLTALYKAIRALWGPRRLLVSVSAFMCQWVGPNVCVCTHVCVHMCVYVFTAVCQPYKESMVKLNRGMFSTCRAYFIIRIWKFSFLCAWEISIHRCASVWEAHSEKPCVRASTDAAACAHTACSCKPVSVGLRKGSRQAALVWSKDPRVCGIHGSSFTTVDC